MNADGDIKARRNNVAAVVERVELKEIDPESLVLPFELLNGSLYRAKIIKTSKDDYLFLDFHHIICDGTSEAIILTDLNKAFLNEELIKEEYTGFEVALREQENLKTDKLEKAKAFYHNILKDVDGEYLIKKDLKVSEISKLKSHDYILDLDNNSLIKFIEKNKLTNNAYFNFAFAFTLSKFLYKDDSLYTTIYNGRNDSKLENSVTMLVKTFPVYFNPKNDSSIVSVIHDAQTYLLNAMSHDIYSFAEIKNEILFTDKTTSELAYEFNFSEPGHLMRFFKKQTGQTVTEFKEEYKGQQFTAE